MSAWIEEFAARNQLSEEAKAELLKAFRASPAATLMLQVPLQWEHSLGQQDFAPVSLETVEPVKSKKLDWVGDRTHWSGAVQVKPGGDGSASSPLDGGGREKQGLIPPMGWAERNNESPTEYMPGLPAPVSTSDDAFFRRYEDLGLIGLGGMGEVRRMRDMALNRIVAIKIIRDDLREQNAALVRFVEEAQITAQLKHPGIVPVHELGYLPDGRIYFSMKEVKGQTLGGLIQQVHQVSQKSGSWQEAQEGWNFRRLIETFHKVCEAVAYAHSRGVLHRDLKPNNVMLGGYGEVLVVDWGVAKVLGRTEREEETPFSITTDRSQHQIHATQSGNLVGTLMYMPPEQALGEVEQLTPAADVYALGAILYEILSGRPPFVAGEAAALLHLVQTGHPYFPVPIGRTSGSVVSEKTVLEIPAITESQPHWHHLWIPPDLLQICQKAMSRQVQDRYHNAGQLAQAISSWLDGSQKREHAQKLVDQARQLLPQVEQFRAEAQEKRHRAEQILSGIKPYDPEEHKIPAWTLQDEADLCIHEAALREVEYLECLQGVLTYAADCEEAHHLLASYYQKRHQEAEAAHNATAAAQYAVQLRSHDVGRMYAAYLKGDGSFSLYTDPVGAQVDLYEYKENNRRLEERFVLHLGKTPKVELPLPMGSYMLVIRGSGHGVVRYPICIHRQEHWHGQAPGETSPRAIWLPTTHDLTEQEVYVPAGWFWAGGDPSSSDGFARQQIWVEGFSIKKFPVTNAEYQEFLNDLVAQGREEEALRCVPRERASTEGEAGAMIYKRDQDGHFVLGPDADGDIWELEWPVMMLDWRSAWAYTQWLRQRTHQDWRLPTELEWEKAARGVDGRFYPWGNHFDASWCCMRDSHTTARLMPARVDSYPVDISPYGVRGMAGNCRDWCHDVYVSAGHIQSRMALPPVPVDAVENPHCYRNFRGGSWLGQAATIRLAERHHALAYNRASHLGFRVCRSLP